MVVFLFLSLTASAAPVVDTASVLSVYAKVVQASYQASVASAKVLQEKIAEFLAAPNEARLEAAQQAWIAARKDYSLTEVYRFYEGPIDKAKGLINAWPLEEAYIDSVVGRPQAGIINDLVPILRSQRSS